MKPIVRTSAVAVLALTGAFASPAIAQIRPVPPIPAACRAPTLAQCQDTDYLDSTCGKRPAARTTCEGLLTGEYKKQHEASALPDSTVFTPPGSIQPRTVQSGKRIPFDPLTLKATPKDDTTFGGMVPIFSSASAGTVTVPKLYVRHPTWISNGTIASCAEYVWEKYYDYSRFEDSARLCGKDLECVYDVAYNRVPNANNGNTNIPLPVPGGSSVVVTPGIAYRTDLKRLDGTAMAPIDLYGPLDGVTGGKLPKNAFFATPVAFLKKKALSGPVALRSVYSAIATRLETNPNYLIGPSAPYKTEWAWHEAMHDAQAALDVTPGERVATEWRLARITRLLQEYWQAMIAEEVSSTPVPIFDPVGSLTKIPGGDIFTPQDPFFFLASLQTVQTKVSPITVNRALDVRSTALEREVALPGFGGITLTPRSLEIEGKGIKIGPIALPAGLSNLLLPNQSIGDRLAAALVEEWQRPGRGCLGADNRCDWSPRMFGNRFLDLFQHERERDFDRCLDATPPKFAPAGPPTGPAPTAAERTSTAALEGFFARRALQFGEQLKDVPVLTSGGPGALPKIGKSWVGGNDFGFPGLLGAAYKYDVGWNISALQMDSSGNICRLGAHANALLNASVWYPQLSLTQPIKTESLVDTDSWVDVRDGSATVHSHFSILGKNLYDPIDGTIAPATPKPIPESSQEQQLFELKKTVIIMGVPVTGALKATAKVGFSGLLGAEGPNGCNKDNLAMKLRGEFLPSGEARANAYLMIGIPGIGAGVEGELLIVRAEVPANASAWMSAEGTQTYLNFHTDAAVKLHTLSGRVEAYAEFCPPLLKCYRTSAELFAWDGWHQTYPLVNLDKKVELLALRNAR